MSKDGNTWFKNEIDIMWLDVSSIFELLEQILKLQEKKEKRKSSWISGCDINDVTSLLTRILEIQKNAKEHKDRGFILMDDPLI